MRYGIGLAVAIMAVGGGVAVAQGGGEPVSSPEPVVVNESFVSPLVERFGDVRVGRGVFVASNTILRADRGRRVCLGNRTNAQDNVIVLGLGRPAGGRAAVRRALGRRRPADQPRPPGGDHQQPRRRLHVHRVPLAHPQRGHLRRRLHRARRDDPGVTIPKDRIVDTGKVITTQAQADALPKKVEGNADFQRDVLEVNAEFAEHYPDLYERAA